MAHQFHKHYTREEAAALIPQLREWLGRLAELRDALNKYEQRIQNMMADGSDAGGSTVNNRLRAESEARTILQEFQSREIQIKDVDRGLLDFPSLIGEREVFLCWEKDEDTIEHWHDLDTGYAGREKIQ
jgi:hypothetical protein